MNKLSYKTVLSILLVSIMLITPLTAFTAVQANSNSDELIKVEETNGNGNLTIANPNNHSIKLTGGQQIPLPDITLTYNLTTNQTLNNLTDTNTLNITSSVGKEFTYEYPYDTYPLYQENDTITVQYEGPERNDNVSLVVTKLPKNGTELENTVGSLIDGGPELEEMIIGDNVTTSLNSSNDYTYSFNSNELNSGNYMAMVFDANNTDSIDLTNVTILSATPIEILQEKLTIESSNTVEKGSFTLDTSLPVNNKTGYAYLGILISKDDFSQFSAYLESDLTQANTNVTINDKSLNDLNESISLEGIIGEFIGENFSLNSTVYGTYPDVSTASESITFDTSHLGNGEYHLFVTVFNDTAIGKGPLNLDEALVSFNHKEITIKEEEEDEDGGGAPIGGVGSGNTITVRPRYQNGQAQKLVTGLQKGKVVEFEPKGLKPDHGIEAVRFKAKEYIGSVNIKTNNLGSNKPENTPGLGNVYSYNEINVEKAENKIEEASITFRVSKQWVEQKEAEPNEVMFKRYNTETNEWEELESEPSGETNSHYKFEVSTPGFSYFATQIEPKTVTGTIVDEGIFNNLLGDVNKEWNELALGKAGAPKVAAEFTEDTMTYNGKEYESEWEKEDYGLIEFEDDNIRIVGTHRFGTRAGSKFYKEQKPDETTLIHWEDQNDDGKVQYDEIEVIN